MSVTHGKLPDEMPTVEEILSTYITADEFSNPALYPLLLAELQQRDIVMRNDAFHAGYGKGYAQDLALDEGE